MAYLICFIPVTCFYTKTSMLWICRTIRGCRWKSIQWTSSTNRTSVLLCSIILTNLSITGSNSTSMYNIWISFTIVCKTWLRLIGSTWTSPCKCWCSIHSNLRWRTRWTKICRWHCRKSISIRSTTCWSDACCCSFNQWKWWRWLCSCWSISCPECICSKRIPSCVESISKHYLPRFVSYRINSSRWNKFSKCTINITSSWIYRSRKTSINICCISSNNN